MEKENGNIKMLISKNNMPRLLNKEDPKMEDIKMIIEITCRD